MMAVNIRPRVNLVVRLEKNHMAFGTRGQKGPDDPGGLLHIFFRICEEFWVKAVVTVGVTWRAIIGPFAVNVRTRTDDDPEFFLPGKLKEMFKVASLVGSAREIKFPAHIFVIIPRDITRDDIDPRFLNPVEDFFPVMRIEPPVMDFAA